MEYDREPLLTLTQTMSLSLYLSQTKPLSLSLSLNGSPTLGSIGGTSVSFKREIEGSNAVARAIKGSRTRRSRT